MNPVPNLVPVSAPAGARSTTSAANSMPSTAFDEVFSAQQPARDAGPTLQAAAKVRAALIQPDATDARNLRDPRPPRDAGPRAAPEIQDARTPLQRMTRDGSASRRTTAADRTGRAHQADQADRADRADRADDRISAQDNAAGVAQAQAAAVASAGLASNQPSAPATTSGAAQPETAPVQGVSGASGPAATSVAPTADAAGPSSAGAAGVAEFGPLGVTGQLGAPSEPGSATGPVAGQAVPAEPGLPGQPTGTNQPVVHPGQSAGQREPGGPPTDPRPAGGAEQPVPAGSNGSLTGLGGTTESVSVPDPGAIGTTATSGTSGADPSMVTAPGAQAVVPLDQPGGISPLPPGPLPAGATAGTGVSQNADGQPASGLPVPQLPPAGTSAPQSPVQPIQPGIAAVQAMTGTSPNTGIRLSRSAGRPTDDQKHGDAAALSGVHAAALGGPQGTTGPAATVDAAGATRPVDAEQPVIDQVMDHLAKQHLITGRNLRDGTHQAILHLNPDNLGQVRVTMDVRAGQVRLDLAAAPQALSALGNDLGQLRSQLADAGLSLGDVTLTTQTDTGGGQQQAPPRDNQFQQPGSSGTSSPPGRPITGRGTAAPDTGPAGQPGRTGPNGPSAPGSVDVLA